MAKQVIHVTKVTKTKVKTPKTNSTPVRCPSCGKFVGNGSTPKKKG